ncbi:hypothetical protein DL96DRAFT_1810595 [Flagelloscypha sp. PMI_526]|nr:hypothetical protein DL96DRAFT_1810595 [Flagelloscypha sp. PMI_526]
MENDRVPAEFVKRGCDVTNSGLLAESASTITLTRAKDGPAKSLDALSWLHILQEAASRWTFDSEDDLRGDEVRPKDIILPFLITPQSFYAVLFSRLTLTIGQAIQAHCVLEEKLFATEFWASKNQDACGNVLHSVLGEIANGFGLEISLDSPLGGRKVHPRKVPTWAEIVASCETTALAGLKVLLIQIEAELFLIVFQKALASSTSAQDILKHIPSRLGQCNELGPFFFRLSLPESLPRLTRLKETYSQLKGTTMAYLDWHAVMTF